MVRVLAVLLLALAPLAHAFPAEWPVSATRVGRASQTAPSSIRGFAGDDGFLVTWLSQDRGGQAAVIGLDGKPVGSTSIGLPLRVYGAFWNDDTWTILGRTATNWGWVRVSRDGVLLDRVARPLSLYGTSLDEAVWTGTSLIVAGRATTTSIGVRTFDENLDLRTSYELPIDYSPNAVRLATDGETALLVYHDLSNVFPRVMHVLLLDAGGNVQRSKDIEADGVVAASSAGNGNGYLVVTTKITNSTSFSGFRLDHDLVKRTIPVGFGVGDSTYYAGETLSWDGSAFVFFYPSNGVRLARLSAAGGILEDTQIISSNPTTGTKMGLGGVAGMGQSLLLFTRGEGLNYEEPHFLRMRAAHDAAGLIASEEVMLERGAFQQVTPAAASNATQSLLAWRERNSVTASHLVYAARVDADGNVRDPQSLLLGAGSCDRTTPSIATNGDSFLVAWYDDSGVVAARVGADGAVANTRVQFSRQQPCEETMATALSNGKDYLVVWRRTDAPRDIVLAARVAADGTLIDTVPIELGNATSNILGASNGTDYLLAWDGRMVRVAANGTRMDSKPGPRVAGESTVAAWWNGTSYSLVQQVAVNFATLYQLAQVTSQGAVTTAA
ncbi:MAG TPA: hypothetical protein VGD79_03385, partial [Thermoanaerobaculia bacterium]